MKNGKTLSISNQKSSDSSNNDKIIENSSQNRNQDSNITYCIDFTKNNNADRISIITAEECTNIQLPPVQKQSQNVRAQQHSKYLNYQNEEIKALGTKDMLVITDVNDEAEIISKETPKDSKDDNN